MIRSSKYHIIRWCSFLVVGLALLQSAAVMAQAKLTASVSPATVPLNGTVQAVFTLSGGPASSFTPPSFTGFSVIGTSRSSGGGMTIILNGKVVQGGDGEEKWIYTLRPKAEGKYTIGAAKAVVSGKTVTSNTLTLEVTKSSTPQKQNQQQGKQNNTSTDGGNDIFIRAIADKSTAYLGEQVTLTYKLYSRVSFADYAVNKLPGFAGFWNHDLLDPKAGAKESTETINGVAYKVFEIRRVALFAQKTGRQTIDPLEMECMVQVIVDGDDFFTNDPFFNNPFFRSFFSSVDWVKKKIRSNEVTVNVVPLPDKDKPEKFSGAVGNFTFTGGADKTTVRQNDPVKLSFKVTGTGNINLIELPEIGFPADFEVYDPEITEDLSVAGGKLAGTRTWEFLFLPRSEGKFTIKPVTFTFFDLVAKKYQSVTLPAIEFTVTKGTGGGSTGNNGRQENVKYLGSDVLFTEAHARPLQRIGRVFFNSPLYYLILVLPLLIFTVFALVWRRRLKLRNDTALMRNIRATGVARKRLQNSHRHLREGNNEMFYIELSKALWGYVSDKFNIPQSELSMENVREALAGRSLTKEVIDMLIETLNQCEYARFAPADPSLSPEKIYDSASEVIRLMENKNNQKNNRVR